MYKAREGDFIETQEGLIFDVKGLVHPPDRVIAYVRYFPDKSGNRKRGNTFYRKIYSLKERERFLKTSYPHYRFYDQVHGRWLEGVPVKDITRHHKPADGLLALKEKKDLHFIEKQTLAFTQQLREASKVPFHVIGVSGSVLVSICTEDSDIDLVVYGKENCMKIHDALKKLLKEKENSISPYDIEGLKKLYKFRVKDTKTSFKDFVKTEKRKTYQGRVFDKDYFIRFILDWSEVEEEYGDRRYEQLGKAKIEARIIDHSNAIFTPCTYKITDCRFVEKKLVARIDEISSFRGRFCEQAIKNEMIVAQGTVEKVVKKNGGSYYRLILGEHPSDFMILKD